MTTVYDVARVAGVSAATVSRVLRGTPLVNQDTRERVLAVIEALEFVPDAYAQGLSNRRTDVIGFAALERGGAEMDIEQNSVLFVDQIVPAAEELRGLAKRMPVVVIAGRRDESELDVLVADNVMTALVSHLIGHHRYRRLCFVTGPKDAPWR
jgi:DNA-binding LacI/PurR family transcriptional regulator